MIREITIVKSKYVANRMHAFCINQNQVVLVVLAIATIDIILFLCVVTILALNHN